MRLSYPVVEKLKTKGFKDPVQQILVIATIPELYIAEFNSTDYKAMQHYEIGNIVKDYLNFSDFNPLRNLVERVVKQYPPDWYKQAINAKAFIDGIHNVVSTIEKTTLDLTGLELDAKRKANPLPTRIGS